MSAQPLVEIVRVMMVELMCPDCPLKASLLHMAQHYKKTGHGRRE